MIRLLLVVVVLMQKDFVITQTHKINGKNFIVPHYDIQGYQRYFMPKLDFKGMQHVYYNPDDIQEVYKQQNMDPDNLECNLTYDPANDKNPLVQAIKQETRTQKQQLKDLPSPVVSAKEQIIPQAKGKPRPPLREKGYTHFIHIPIAQACKQLFQNQIKTVVDNDLDALVPLNTLHATIMVFRLNSEEDLPKWKKILQSLKLRKVKISLRGVGIFPVKVNTNFTRVFFIKVTGIDDLIHDIVQKAISQGLVTQKQLSNILFDKKTDMYRSEQPHLTILKTKGEDIIDATEYMKQLAKLSIPRVAFSDIRLSMIGTFDGQGYFDQMVVPVDK